MAVAFVPMLMVDVPLHGVSVLGNPVSCDFGAAPWLSVETDPLGAVESRLPTLRVVTYNLHSGLGADFSLWHSRAEVEHNLREIARAIAKGDGAGVPADVVGLNEVDFGSRRSGGFDQARFLATELERLTGYTYRVVTGETWRRNLPGFEVRYGNAALVRHEILHDEAIRFDQLVEDADALPLPRRQGIAAVLKEPRGVLKVRFDYHGHSVDLIVTHLDAFAVGERERQAAELLRKVVEPGHTTVLVGDINAVPTMLTMERSYFVADRTHDILTSGRLADARIIDASLNAKARLTDTATYPAERPEWPLDAVFGSLDLVVEDIRVIGGAVSDHRGLSVGYKVVEGETRERLKALHDAIRRQQLAHVLSCDVQGPEAAAKRAWLESGTGFVEVASPDERRNGFAVRPAATKLESAPAL